MVEIKDISKGDMVTIKDDICLNYDGNHHVGMKYLVTGFYRYQVIIYQEGYDNYVCIGDIKEVYPTSGKKQ